MPGQPRNARRLAASLVLAALLATCPLEQVGVSAVVAHAQECSIADLIQSTTCRLRDGETVERTLDAQTGSATYRVDTITSDVTLDLVLMATGGSTRLAVLDWRGKTLGAAIHEDGASETRLRTKLPLAGAYGVVVNGDASADSQDFKLIAQFEPPSPERVLFWPPPFVPDAGPLRDERQVVRTPRVGTPTTPSVHGRALGAPPDGMLNDFTFVADVQFERIAGPSALTVRFRYEPEAGGGTGYLLTLDPFVGTVSLDSFEEGLRRTIAGDQPIPIVPTPEAPNRLVLVAEGPLIRATLDGQPLLEATDSRYTRGLVVVGAVTWSDPVAVTFDHIQVTTPPR